MKKRSKIILLLAVVGIQAGLIGFQFLLLSNYSRYDNPEMSMWGATTLIIAADSYAHDDLTSVKNQLSEWNCRVEIAGITANITSTDGHEIATDYLVTDIYDISVFDAIFIPGHEEVEELLLENTVVELLETVDTDSTVIAGIDNGTLAMAEAGIINGKNFVAHPGLIDDIEILGGVFINESVVSDNGIITSVARDYTVIDDHVAEAVTTNYDEMSYAVANAMGYSYTLTVDLSFVKETSGWNYSLLIEPSDHHIVQEVNISLYTVTDSTKTLVAVFTMSERANSYTSNFGILPNGYYSIDASISSIYGNIEYREAIKEFSVGGN